VDKPLVNSEAQLDGANLCSLLRVHQTLPSAVPLIDTAPSLPWARTQTAESLGSGFLTPPGSLIVEKPPSVAPGRRRVKPTKARGWVVPLFLKGIIGWNTNAALEHAYS